METPIQRIVPYQGTIALDGEREMTFHAGDEITYWINRNGPIRVDVKLALESAMNHGMFRSLPISN